MRRMASTALDPAINHLPRAYRTVGPGRLRGPVEVLHRLQAFDRLAHALKQPQSDPRERREFPRRRERLFLADAKPMPVDVDPQPSAGADSPTRFDQVPRLGAEK